MLTYMNDLPNRIGPPAGWREDGPDAFRKLPPPAARQARYSPLSEPDDDELYEAFYGEDQCTPSRRTRLTAQPQAEPKPIVYAQYDSRFDPALHPELDYMPPHPAKPVPQPVPELPSAPAPDAPIPVEWPTRVITPVPLSARR